MMEDPPTDDDVFPCPESRPPTNAAAAQGALVDSNGVGGDSIAKSNETSSSTEQPMTHDKNMTVAEKTSTVANGNDDMQALMQHVNDQLEQSMADYKSKVKRVFKELVTLQQEYQAVQEIWAPIQLAEQKEAARLDTLQVDVDRTMAPWLAATSVPQDGVVHNHTSATGGTDSH